METTNTIRRHIVGIDLDEHQEAALRRATGTDAEEAVQLALAGAVGELVAKGERGLEADRRIAAGSLEVGRAAGAE